ncbi:MAG TPA: cytochrome c3 family protein [Anaeromyxobacteraceae bacterium]|nr:cytochrome c3 family protein [Anaeromyxobacteraceae bacterium]
MNRLPLLAVAALAGCSARIAPKAAPEQVAHVFPHQPHLENDVACSNCHASIEQATRLDAAERHVALPAKSDKCGDCHETMPTLAIPARTSPFELSFDHAAHLPRVNGDCKVCHLELPEKDQLHTPVPPMSVCTACHVHQQEFAEARCTPCHVDLRSHGPKPLSTFAHREDWLRTHGELARASAQSCAACHDQTYCANCHSAATVAARPSVRWPEQVTADLIHRGDYVSRHMVDVQADPASCRRCHGSPFCQSCHELQNVAPTGSLSDRDPHPTSGWATPSGGEHAAAARANIVACAGCHDQGAAATCVTCHRSGGANPHPPGFASRHSASEQHSKKVCIVCHGP